ncbi:sporulation inhibitor of replication protein SirA [Paenalkalicoccus suaedae]|uniref:Sporulation inhibitor of replication protein SirA n=1 Tax=Paenalkalicoccus suaedae TaxID=2592382 RepID=A0A859FGL5_9BACI|nr:sporulation inhibitor of replication protein SirA [Paenalkalicoccus suaedae]QKS71345.1 sporulation inhibitor of replication protein SirA [Paenalkalicoccus suaedae]
MREYEISLLSASVAKRYYRMENKLYQLFCENRLAHGTLKLITTKQIEYIRKPFDQQALDEYLYSHLVTKEGYSHHAFLHRLSFTHGEVTVYVGPDSMKVQATGSLDHELHIFDLLASFEQTFLAIEFGQGRYGWVSREVVKQKVI